MDIEEKIKVGEECKEKGSAYFKVKSVSCMHTRYNFTTTFIES